MSYILSLINPLFWLILAIVFIIIELSTAALITIWFALSAILLIFISFLEITFLNQVLIFLLIAIVLLLLTRPVLQKKLLKNKVNTNVDSLIGKTALVTKTITQFEKGEIKINGLNWSAKAENDGQIAENTECTIVCIEGVTAIVRKKEGKI